MPDCTPALRTDHQGNFVVPAPPSLTTEVAPQGRGGAATSTCVDYDRAP
jgi:hypothetical protein